MLSPPVQRWRRVDRASLLRILVDRHLIEHAGEGRLTVAVCVRAECRKPVPVKQRGRPPRFCSPRCRSIADQEERVALADASPLRLVRRGR